MMDPRARIPSVERLLDAAAREGLQDGFGHDRVADAIRLAVAECREALSTADTEGPDWLVGAEVDDPDPYLSRAAELLEEADRPSLRPVLNATGVVLHTNLGRAPLAAEARRAMATVTAGYANLEFDLEAGERGSRYTHCAGLVARLTGAEDALVVNNCAGALALALGALARGRDVAISRGEMVEIGGSFRMPEVAAQAGAGLREVGATNRTRPADYRAAVRAGGIGAILRVHRSNFRITGFTESAPLAELAELAREAGVPLVHDLGSGLMVDPGLVGLPAEPTPAESLARGADLVIFSGDKLLGGPQAGLIAGRADLVRRLRSSPLCRALRVDKAALAALEATLRLYASPEEALARIPALAMLATSVEALEARARTVADAVAPRVPGSLEVVTMEGRVGGGTFPGHAVPSAGLRWTHGPARVHRAAARLRASSTPVVGRVEDGALLLDLRTILPDQDPALVAALVAALIPRPGGEDRSAAG